MRPNPVGSWGRAGNRRARLADYAGYRKALKDAAKLPMTSSMSVAKRPRIPRHESRQSDLKENSMRSLRPRSAVAPGAVASADDVGEIRVTGLAP